MVNRQGWGTILVILCLSDLCSSGKRSKPPKTEDLIPALKTMVKIRVTAVNCTFKTGYYKTICLFNPSSKSGISGDLHLRLLISKVQEESFMELKGSSKGPGSTTYNRVFFKQKIDYCRLAENGNNVPNLLTQFAPDLFKTIVLPMCPVSGNHELNITVPAVTLDAMFVRHRDYKIEFTFTSATDVNLWKMTVFLLGKEEPIV